MAGDHDLTGHVWLGCAELFVNDGEGELFVEGGVVFKIRVDEDVGLGLEVGFAFSEEFPVLFWDVIEAARAVGLEGFGAAPDAEPVVTVSEVHLGEEEFFLMVSGEKGDVELVFQADEEVDDAFAVWATVDVVAHEDDAVLGLRVDGFPDIFKGVEAAVNVSNCKCSHGRKVLERACEFSE